METNHHVQIKWGWAQEIALADKNLNICTIEAF